MSKRILIVDDSKLNATILSELLETDSNELRTASTGEECLEMLEEFRPDLVLLDIMMPGIDGYETCRFIKEGFLGVTPQVILVSGKAAMSDRLSGYQAGADDYIVKPFDHEELLAKVRVHLRLHKTMVELREANKMSLDFNKELEVLVKDRTDEIVATRDVVVFALAKLTESRDPEMGEHLERMRKYTMILTKHLDTNGPYQDQIDQRFIDDIYRASPLHDIGKVGVPDAILAKPGRLSKVEFDMMKLHCHIGADALTEVVNQTTCGNFLKMAIEVTLCHHEWFNGAGYPDGLAGQDIPLPARIVALADVYDAVTSVRIYKPAYSPEEAKVMIDEEYGTHFDPAIVDAFHATEDLFLDVVLSSGDETDILEINPADVVYEIQNSSKCDTDNSMPAPMVKESI